MNRLFILGADDPEMSAIEKLLIESGCEVAYALDASGVRVHGDNAYRASRVSSSLLPFDTLCFVECELPGEIDSFNIEIIDHHRPGDPGHGKPPAEFMSASSIGQVIAILAEENTLPARWDRSPSYMSLKVKKRTPPKRGDFYWFIDRWTVAYQDNSGYPSSPWHAASLAFVPLELAAIAAVDHCLDAAHAGLCPGVYPTELMKFLRKPI